MLDEYIHMNNVPKPIQSQNCQEYSGVSKFDRYKNQDEIDEEMEDGNYSIESHSTDGLSNQMPKLVPFQQNTMPKKKPIHTRLGERGSVCESIHTSQMKLFRPNIFKAKVSVQKRLGKNYSNPAMNERNRITLHTLNSIANKASKNNMLHDDRLLFNTLTKRIGYNAEPDPEPEPKYNMKIQKEISYLQVNPLQKINFHNQINLINNFHEFVVFAGKRTALCVSRSFCGKQRWTRFAWCD